MAPTPGDVLDDVVTGTIQTSTPNAKWVFAFTKRHRGLLRPRRERPRHRRAAEHTEKFAPLHVSTQVG